MDNRTLKDLQRWVSEELDGQSRVVAAFSGSYASAVGYGLVSKSFSGDIIPTKVCIKEEAWKLDLAEAWLSRLHCPLEILKVFLNETWDDLEDQIPGLSSSKDRTKDSLVKFILNALSSSYSCPVVWFGDRGDWLRGEFPLSSNKVVAPLAHLSYRDIRKLGSALGISDEWVSDFEGLPSKNWYGSERVRAKREDDLLGWVVAHLGDLEDAESSSDWQSNAVGSGDDDFQWLGWTPEDASDRVILEEIVRSIKTKGNSPPRSYGSLSETDSFPLMDGPYTLSLTGHSSNKASLLGSIRAEVDLMMEDTTLLIKGIDESGEKKSYLCKGPSEKLCQKMLSSLEGKNRARIPACFTDEGGESVWHVLSLSRRGIQDLRSRFEEVLSYAEILPEEIVDRPLTEDEKESRRKHSEELARAKRPTSKRR